MKITISQLKKIIKEEAKKVLYTHEINEVFDERVKDPDGNIIPSGTSSLNPEVGAWWIFNDGSYLPCPWGHDSTTDLIDLRGIGSLANLVYKYDAIKVENGRFGVDQVHFVLSDLDPRKYARIVAFVDAVGLSDDMEVTIADASSSHLRYKSLVQDLRMWKFTEFRDQFSSQKRM